MDVRVPGTGEEGRDGSGDWVRHIYTTDTVSDDVGHREVSPVLWVT